MNLPDSRERICDPIEACVIIADFTEPEEEFIRLWANGWFADVEFRQKCMDWLHAWDGRDFFVGETWEVYTERCWYRIFDKGVLRPSGVWSGRYIVKSHERDPSGHGCHCATRLGALQPADKNNVMFGTKVWRPMLRRKNARQSLYLR